MRLCILFCTLWFAGLASCAAEKFKIVCYFTNWATYRPGYAEFNVTNIDPTLCTHIIYAFVGLTDEGDVDILDPWSDLADGGGAGGFEHFVALRDVNPEIKFMVAIGGWSQGSASYSKVVGNSTLRSHFVESIVNFTLQWKFDGFDLDWEYPAQRNGSSPADVENYVLLLKELRPIFDENNLIISAAVPAQEDKARMSYNIPALSEYVDFINLMTYEYHSSLEAATGVNTPLYRASREITRMEQTLNIDASVKFWLSAGAPADKIILGMASYGKTFTLQDPTKHVPGSPSNGPGTAGEYTREAGVLAYYEICERLLNGGWTAGWDEEQLSPYAYNGDQWITYDNPRSIAKRTKYLKKLGLGGAMVWSLDLDDFSGKCGEKNPILKTINKELRKHCGNV